MVPQCARPCCTSPAAATFTFDGLRRVVWVNPLASASAYSAGNLCRRHADRLRPPRDWELRDTRPVPSSREPAGVSAPSRYQPPPPLPPLTLPLEPARRPSLPVLAAASRPAGPGRDADTPLLSRAFRSAG